MDRHQWDAAYSGPELVWGAGPNRFVVEETSELRPGRAIDLATGEGRNAIWLASRGWKVTGVDFSETGLARAAALAAERGVTADWVRADLAEYEAEPGAFDLVLIAYLQLERSKLDPVLAMAARAVAPGGTVLVIGHDVGNLDGGVGGPQDPRALYTPEAIVSALPGLSVRTAERRLRPVPGADGGQPERHAIDTVVAAVAPRLNGQANVPAS
jgi:SAM-dependent methyltransferase